MVPFKALARFLSAVALCAMLGAPFAVDVAAAATVSFGPRATASDAAIGGMTDMPCCPDMNAERDCSKTCVLMAVCATSIMHMATMVVREASHVLVSRESPPGMPPLAGVDDILTPRPPNSVL